jgi:cell division protein FtsN
MVIQVASVQDIKAAEQMVAKLQAQGMQAYWVAGDVAGKGTWYRVRVGSFASKTEATEALNRLAQNNIKGMILETRQGGQ